MTVRHEQVMICDFCNRRTKPPGPENWHKAINGFGQPVHCCGRENCIQGMIHFCESSSNYSLPKTLTQTKENKAC